MSELDKRNSVLEDWLRTEVVAAYDAMKLDPTRGRTVADVRAALTVEHERAAKQPHRPL
jgi:hypothetical protein